LDRGAQRWQDAGIFAIKNTTWAQWTKGATGCYASGPAGYKAVCDARRRKQFGKIECLTNSLVSDTLTVGWQTSNSKRHETVTKRKEQKLLSDQLREILGSGPMTRYRLSKEAGVDQGQLSRFVLGKGQMTFNTLDRIGKVLKLRLVVDADE
jgi:hypothetical protein